MTLKLFGHIHSKIITETQCLQENRIKNNVVHFKENINSKKHYRLLIDQHTLF